MCLYIFYINTVYSIPNIRIGPQNPISLGFSFPTAQGDIFTHVVWTDGFCILLYDKEAHQIFTFKKLEPLTVWHCCFKNDLHHESLIKSVD